MVSLTEKDFSEYAPKMVEEIRNMANVEHQNILEVLDCDGI